MAAVTVLAEFSTIVEYNFDDAPASVMDHYRPQNSAIAGVKSWGDELFLTVPRWREGVPATLNRLDDSGQLVPYPSWAMNLEGDCSALNYVQSMEIDPFRDEMWVIDRTVNWNSTSSAAENNCPAKVVILDLAHDGQVIDLYNFPTDVVSPTSNFLNDIVLDTDNQVAYITDAVDSKIVVFDRAHNSSWYFSDETMEADPATHMVIEGVDYGDGDSNGVTAANDGIALSPDGTRLFYMALHSEDLWSVSTSVLRDETATLEELQATRIHHGRKPPSDGMIFDCAGNLFYGGLTTSELYSWKYVNADSSLDEYSVSVVDDHRHWLDTFAIDDGGHLIATVNKLDRFLQGTMDFNASEGANFQVLRYDDFSEQSYLHGSCVSQNTPGKGTSVATEAMVVSFIALSSVLGIGSAALLVRLRREARKGEEGNGNGQDVLLEEKIGV